MTQGRGRRRLVRAAAVTGLCAAAVMSMAATASAKPAAAPSADFQHEVELRTQFGLEHDEEWVNAVDADPTSTADILGVPLTPAESANIKGRDRLNAVLGKIEALGGKLPLFGGVAIDQAAGGLVKISLTKDPSNDAAAKTLFNSLTALVPADVKTELAVQDVSLSALKATYNALNQAWAAGDLKSMSPTTITQTPTSIKVTTTSSTPDEIQALLRSRFNAPYIDVTTSAGVDFQYSRNPSSGPVYGGIVITTDEDGGRECSSGFSKARGGSSGTSYYEITAGHCAIPGYHWHEGKRTVNGDHFGTGTSNNGAFGGGTSKCDCQSIGPVPSSAATKNFLTTGDAISSQMTGLPSNTNDSAGYGIGRRVCMSGGFYSPANGGRLLCGAIESQNLSDTYDNQTLITNLIVTSATGSLSGDSGGTLISDSDFMGIHQAAQSSDGHQVFSRSVYMASVTGATPSF